MPGEWAGRLGWEHWREAEGATTENVSWARTQRNFEPQAATCFARFAPVHASREQVVGERGQQEKGTKNKSTAIAVLLFLGL